MDEDIHIDTGLLRDQVSVIQEEKRVAQQLYDKVEMLKNLSEDGVRAQYQSILGRIDKMVQYYSKMAEAMEYVTDEALNLHRQLENLVHDDTVNADNDISKRFL